MSWVFNYTKRNINKDDHVDDVVEVENYVCMYVCMYAGGFEGKIWYPITWSNGLWGKDHFWASSCLQE
jgi:hypothetical protein